MEKISDYDAFIESLDRIRKSQHANIIDAEDALKALDLSARHFYRASAQERRQIFEVEWEKADDSVSILLEVEYLATMLAGLASSPPRGSLNTIDGRTVHDFILRLDPLKHLEIKAWLSENEYEYPLFACYIETLSLVQRAILWTSFF